MLDIAASNLLELEVPGNIRGHQNVGQLSIGHKQLGDQVDVPVIDPPVFLPWLLAGADVAVFLEQLQKSVNRVTLELIGVHTASMLTEAASLW